MNRLPESLLFATILCILMNINLNNYRIKTLQHQVKTLSATLDSLSATASDTISLY